jgi:hypothetical protein
MPCSPLKFNLRIAGTATCLSLILMLFSCVAYSLILLMEATCSSYTSVGFRRIKRQFPLFLFISSTHLPLTSESILWPNTAKSNSDLKLNLTNPHFWEYFRFKIPPSLQYIYHDSGHYPSSCLLFKTLRFGDWILSPSSVETYSVGPNT